MKKWTLIIDVAKCHDCNNCFLSCKDEFCGNDYSSYAAPQPDRGHRWMNVMRKERGQYPMVDVAYLPLPCMHCEQPACMEAAADGAIVQRDDGIVIIDPNKAKHQKEIVTACPYEAVWWNEELQIPQKCNLCAHLLDNGWKEPRCVQACPTGALQLIKVEDQEITKRIADNELNAYQSQHMTAPRVLYRNLYRYTACFIAGSAALADVDECAAGAAVKLFDSQGTQLAECKTDNYGDFKFDNLSRETGQVTLELDYSGYKKQKITMTLEKSVTLGVLVFAK